MPCRWVPGWWLDHLSCHTCSLQGGNAGVGGGLQVRVTSVECRGGWWVVGSVVGAGVDGGFNLAG
jgi:hypothetical protein